MKPVETRSHPNAWPIQRSCPRIVVFRPFVDQLPSWPSLVRQGRASLEACDLNGRARHNARKTLDFMSPHLRKSCYRSCYRAQPWSRWRESSDEPVVTKVAYTLCSLGSARNGPFETRICERPRGRGRPARRCPRRSRSGTPCRSEPAAAVAAAAPGRRCGACAPFRPEQVEPRREPLFTCPGAVLRHRSRLPHPAIRSRPFPPSAAGFSDVRPGQGPRAPSRAAT